MKDAYYFPHDSNAKDDPKSVSLIEELGLEGYGIFWILIETLRDQPTLSYPMKLIPALAKRYNANVEKVMQVVTDYDLFKIKKKYDTFFSVSLNKRMKEIDEKRQKRSKAGTIGNSVRWNDYRNAIAMRSQEQYDRIANKEKKIKKKETSKVRENPIKQESLSFTPPHKIEVVEFFKERMVEDAEIQAEIWMNHYKSNGWLVGKNEMQDWRASVSKWVIKYLENKKLNRKNTDDDKNVNEKWRK